MTFYFIFPLVFEISAILLDFSSEITCVFTFSGLRYEPSDLQHFFFEATTPEIGGGGEVDTVEWTDEGGVRGWSLTLDRG